MSTHYFCYMKNVYTLFLLQEECLHIVFVTGRMSTHCFCYRKNVYFFVIGKLPQPRGPDVGTRASCDQDYAKITICGLREAVHRAADEVSWWWWCRCCSGWGRLCFLVCTYGVVLFSFSKLKVHTCAMIMSGVTLKLDICKKVATIHDSNCGCD